jgi:hypothetical protein
MSSVSTNDGRDLLEEFIEQHSRDDDDAAGVENAIVGDPVISATKSELQKRRIAFEKSRLELKSAVLLGP